nr:MAG TPA_asm: hypothetical protein [Caudoviricetes sp.]
MSSFAQLSVIYFFVLYGAFLHQSYTTTPILHQFSESYSLVLKSYSTFTILV